MFTPPDLARLRELASFAQAHDREAVEFYQAGRRAEAAAAATKAVASWRELQGLMTGPVTALRLAGSLNYLPAMLSGLGRREEALAAVWECGDCVLPLRPDDPHLWSHFARDMSEIKMRTRLGLDIHGLRRAQRGRLG